MNPYCMQIVTHLCFQDRIDLGAMRVRMQKGNMSLAKVTTVCTRQLGAFLKRSLPASSTLKLSRIEYERACSKTFAACAKRLGAAESKKKDGSEPPHVVETSPDKSSSARRSSRIHRRSSMPSVALQIQPLQQVPLSKDALGKRKSREESSDEDSDDGKLISSKLRIPRESDFATRGSSLTIPKLTPGKFPLGQALTLLKTPLGSALATPQDKPSPSSSVLGSSLGEALKNDLPPVALSSATFKSPEMIALTRALDDTLVGARSPNAFPGSVGVVTSVSASTGGSDTCPTIRHGSEGKRPASASRKNHFLEDAFGGDSKITGSHSHPIDASQEITSETALVPQRSEATKATGGHSSGADACLASAAVGTSSGEVIIVSPETMNNFDSPNTFLEQLTSSAMRTLVFFPSELGEDVGEGLFARPSMPQLPEMGITALASDSLVVSSLAGGEPVAPVVSVIASAGTEAIGKAEGLPEFVSTASVELMEEMLRISWSHLPAEAVGSLSGQDDLLQQASDHIWMSYVCAFAARREYAAAVHNSSKMVEQAATLEEARTGRRVAEANRDVLAEAVKKLEAELAEVKEKGASTEAKLVGSVEIEMERDKLKPDLVTMTNNWMEKIQFCVEHEKRMKALNNIINDL
ncbi:uncharacterized protein LOC133800459 [Humulus lupulus]|uniref:uncharacterized protein LOC133800459 n=1 Tax=Humulus lupulus TaxID=3486 RepID=UPI002B40BF3E|nr:uncharacterized protein LOC133800459 [Humulus lupulus]